MPPLLYGDEEGLRGGARISGDDRVMVWISWLRSEAKEENQRNMAVLVIELESLRRSSPW